MKTIAALSLFLMVLGTGCAATPSDGGGDGKASSEAVTGTNFEDSTPGGKTALELLKAKPTSTMTIAAHATGPTWAKAWRYDMSAKGFTVTAIDDKGEDGTKYAFAIENVNGQLKLVGIATDYQYTSLDRIREMIGYIKADFQAAQANVPEVEDPGVPADPNAWSPTPASCSNRTSNLISAAMNIGVAIDVAAVVMMATGVGAPIAFITMGAGAALMLGGQQADHDLCGNGSGAF